MTKWPALSPCASPDPMTQSSRCATATLRTVQREQGAGAALQALGALMESRMEVNVFHYNTVISGWAMEGDGLLARKIFRQMCKSDIRPTIVSYGALASAVGKDMLWHLSMDLLQQIKPAALEPNAVLLSSAAASLQQGQQWRLASRMLCTMMMQEVLANLICLNSVMSALAKTDQWLAALQQLSEMFQVALEPDSASYVCCRGSWHKVCHMLRSASLAGIRRSHKLVNMGAAACAADSQWHQVLLLLREMAMQFLQLTVVSFNTAVNACGRVGGLWPRASTLLQVTAEKLQPNVVTFNTHINGLEESNWGLSLALVDRMSYMQVLADQLTRNCIISSGHWQLGLDYISSGIKGMQVDLLGLNSAISSSERCGHWWDALALFESISHFCRPSVVSQNAVLSACEQGVEWKRALVLLRQWRRMRTADTFSYNSSISACSVAWTQSLQCFGDMAGVMTRDLVAYNAASHALGSSGFWMQSLRLFYFALRDRVEHLDPAAYGTLVMACGSGFQWSFSLTYLRAMTNMSFYPHIGITSSAVSGCEKSGQPFCPQGTPHGLSHSISPSAGPV
ncbi:unnamed protein product [Durusdinium trenchii]|uniref:Pentatricopeptide repeat-containing protein, chloroplastic n=2 Tax=Durusdinium trenchii TaxID=1381693 RepID=A0ABP0SI55_9DINO